MPFVSTNVVGAVTLLEAARSNGVPIFLHVSTDEVYGSIEGGKFATDSLLDPSSAYSSSKASADLILRSFWKTHGYDVRITRCTNNYGPFQHREKLIPTIINNALESREIPVYGDGQQVRDWIFVEDHCDGLFAALEGGRAGAIYHFGGPLSEDVPNIEIVDIVLENVAEATGRPLGELRELVRHVTDRLGHDRRYALDWSQTREALSWEPRTSFREGLERTIRWYLENEDER
jgi:dTDP-glucose 4,6-dehydratase